MPIQLSLLTRVAVLSAATGSFALFVAPDKAWAQDDSATAELRESVAERIDVFAHPAARKAAGRHDHGQDQLGTVAGTGAR